MAKSRTHAHSLIISGLVRCDGRIVMRPSFEVSGSEKIEISGDVCPYVSRGGLKLEYALDEFGINPRERPPLISALQPEALPMYFFDAERKESMHLIRGTVSLTQR